MIAVSLMPTERRCFFTVVLPWLLSALVILVLGMVVYARRTPTLGEHWLGVTAPVNAWRPTLAPCLDSLPVWLLDSGPDAAWSFSLAAIVAVIAGRGRMGIAWRVAGFVLAVGYEVGQRYGVVPGTFDSGDLIAIIFAYALASASVEFTTPLHSRLGKSS